MSKVIPAQRRIRPHAFGSPPSIACAQRVVSAIPGPYWFYPKKSLMVLFSSKFQKPVPCETELRTLPCSVNILLRTKTELWMLLSPMQLELRRSCGGCRLPCYFRMLRLVTKTELQSNKQLRRPDFGPLIFYIQILLSSVIWQTGGQRQLDDGQTNLTKKEAKKNRTADKEWGFVLVFQLSVCFWVLWFLLFVWKGFLFEWALLRGCTISAIFNLQFQRKLHISPTSLKLKEQTVSMKQNNSRLNSCLAFAIMT